MSAAMSVAPIAELPFETNRGFSAPRAALTTAPDLAVKGAPEIVLAACTTVRRDDGGVRL